LSNFVKILIYCRQHKKGGEAYRKAASNLVLRLDQEIGHLYRTKCLECGGDETNRLHRWGYKKYREMFNAWQLLGLELSCQEIGKEANGRMQEK
jgi:hypothetical protein